MRIAIMKIKERKISLMTAFRRKRQSKKFKVDDPHNRVVIKIKMKVCNLNRKIRLVKKQKARYIQMRIASR